ncbi:hypothetical protein Tco_1189741, partial [Tanacetum coccineum]
MPSLDKGTVREEPHAIDNSVLGRVADDTTLPTPIPRATPEQTRQTRLDRKVVTNADNAAKRKASTGPEISTNATKKTRSRSKGLEEAHDVTLDDGDQRDDVMTQSSLWRIMKASTMSAKVSIYIYNEVEPHVELSGGVRTTRASSHASRGISEDASHRTRHEVALDVQDAEDDGNGSDGNVDPYYEARVGNTIGDVLE